MRKKKKKVVLNIGQLEKKKIKTHPGCHHF